MKAFQQYLLNWYHHHGRTHLPWRQNYDPYKILVSELMLQQTQVERVIPKYEAFLKRFPTIEALNKATLADVLTLWQGLGYNRRAKFLHQTAQTVVKQHHGIFPTTYEGLLALPGVGNYTASAIMAFAYNQPITVIETNVRTVFIYHFFPQRENVTDQELLPLIEASLYTENPRLWYSAMMDYGTVLKKLLPNPSRKSKSYTKQSSFANSPRKVRGDIIRLLTTNSQLLTSNLHTQITGNPLYLPKVLADLEKEKLILRDGDIIELAK